VHVCVCVCVLGGGVTIEPRAQAWAGYLLKAGSQRKFRRCLLVIMWVEGPTVAGHF
jgi:hypothetical protein